MRRWPVILLLTLFGLPPAARADAPSPADFRPDPRTVQRYGPAYRYPQAGWIVLHVEGEPYDRGVQHGRLLAPEIAAHVRCFATTQGSKDPSAAWRQTRTLVNALFLRRYDKEYLEEMKGIADGASAAGARFDNRPIDLTDVVALNAWPEVMTLDSALAATPTGLEGIRFPLESPAAKLAPKPERCSAFAATGPATKDGKVVFGHITMFSLYPSNFYNVWLDVKPAKGHRVFMQTFPAGIQSGMDYYYNDAGLLCCETTISQTRFDGSGMALASRIRQAMQYADTIDKAADVLKEANNGLYTNEWLLADVKTNEIAMLELGTHKTKLWRSSKGEWFGGTPGFYWGCNNTKDLDVRLETLATTDGRPATTAWRPSDRDKKWLELYDRYNGKMDESFGKVAFTTAPIAAYHSVDAKFTTTDLAKGMKTWALFGPPLGRTWQPSTEELKRYPEIRPLVSNPWTVLHAVAPQRDKDATVAVDLHDPADGRRKVTAAPTGEAPQGRGGRRGADAQELPAWHGTLLPKTDADTWLVTAFAAYERVVSSENAMRKRGGGKLSAEDRDRLAVTLFQYRSEYELGRRAHPEVALAKTKADVRQNDWHRVASGKGVLLLHALRNELGAEKFAALMEDFGKQHGGKPVSAEEFRAFVEKGADRKLDDFFDRWLQDTGLPKPKEGGATSEAVTGQEGGPFGVQTFFDELEQTLIVYGTLDDAASNREAALDLQKGIVERGSNITVPVKSDREATDEDLKTHHLVLVGRPGTNGALARLRLALPVTFGGQSFAVRGETYAHMGSGVLVAAENPRDGRYSVVVAAGMSP
ncbi:MAG TPA: C45 family autoproteolytic acyltransferase/hydrolase, partial [Gemmataceae bacterium]|nr:C45 family autoproteolytic acyltransferase/hydrolase [Gemmataceae bacterium]